MKKYIHLNNYHRTLAKNVFEQNFFKLLNKAVYGKTKKIVDKWKGVKIVCEWESSRRRLGATALISKYNFHTLLRFSDEMIAIQMKKLSTVYNKPTYFGFTVLELSK